MAKKKKVLKPDMPARPRKQEAHEAAVAEIRDAIRNSTRHLSDDDYLVVLDTIYSDIEMMEMAKKEEMGQED